MKKTMKKKKKTLLPFNGVTDMHHLMIRTTTRVHSFRAGSTSPSLQHNRLCSASGRGHPSQFWLRFHRASEMKTKSTAEAQRCPVSVISRRSSRGYWEWRSQQFEDSRGFGDRLGFSRLPLRDQRRSIPSTALLGPAAPPSICR